MVILIKNEYNPMMTENYDIHELNKFASKAMHWWDTTGEFKTLHEINPLRLRYILEKTELINKKIIDIGCGGGILSESMAKQGAHVTGIDMNKPVIDVAKLHQLESGTAVEYLLTSAESIASTRPAFYDIVTCFELLEHVPNPASIMEACATLVKPNGHLFFSTLNRNIKSYLFAIVGAEYVLKLLPKDTHDFAKFIRPSELSNWARKYQILPQEIKGISYHPLTKQFSLTNDISVNYILHAVKNNA